jgi:hypothetical protein
MSAAHGIHDSYSIRLYITLRRAGSILPNQKEGTEYGFTKRVQLSFSVFH